MSKSIVSVSQKLSQLDKDQKQGRKGGRRAGKNDEVGLDSKQFKEISQESSKIAVECNHGMMVEALKEFMFTERQHHHHHE